MVTRAIVNKMYDFFENYIEKYEFDSSEKDALTYAKYNHTMGVKDLCIEIAKDIFKSDEDIMLCEIIGLFHDIGRWKQFYLYKTFRDSDSDDHGKLSREILIEQNILSKLSENEQNIILESIYNHNKRDLTNIINKDIMPYAKVIRDADKLDNYNTQSNKNISQETKDIMNWGLPETNGVSDETYNSFLHEKYISLKNVKNINDRMFVVMSWVFDINFKKSFQIIWENNYIDKLYDLITGKDSRTQEMYQIIKEHIKERI